MYGDSTAGQLGGVRAGAEGTDRESTFADRSARSIVGAQMTAKAANDVGLGGAAGVTLYPRAG